MVPSNELLARLREHYKNVERTADEVNDTARSWQIPGYEGTFGFISSMSDHFCSSCNRLRITADGQIKVITDAVLRTGDRLCSIGLPLRCKGGVIARRDAPRSNRRRVAPNYRASSDGQTRKARTHGGYRCCDEPSNDTNRWLSVLSRIYLYRSCCLTLH